METVSQAQKAVPESRTINGKPLLRDVTLNAGDVAAYTKVEVDNKIQNIGGKNTALKAPDGWWQCGDTGMIYQWGKVTRTGNDTRVTFPLSFTNQCVNVQISLSIRPYDSDHNIAVHSVDINGFTYYGESNESVAFWFAVGY